MKLFKRKIIYFLHVYKTRASAIREILSRKYHRNEIFQIYYTPWEDENFRNKKLSILQQTKISSFTKIVFGHFMYGIHEKFDTPFTYMTFLRDPFDRAIASYEHFLRLDKKWQTRILSGQDERIRNQKDLIKYFPDFKEYIKFEEMQNQQCMFLTGTDPLAISEDPVYHANIAINNLKEHFSFIGLTDRFDLSLSRLETKLNFRLTEKDIDLIKDYSQPEIKIAKPDELRSKIYKKNEADKMIYDFVVKNYYS